MYNGSAKEKYLFRLLRGCRGQGTCLSGFPDLPAVSQMQSGAAGVQDKGPDQWQALSGPSRQESDPVDIVDTERTTPVSKKEPSSGHQLHCCLMTPCEKYCQ